jgi:hypothetical protein
VIAARSLAREEWERELRYYGCYPQAGLTKLNTAEWWRLPFAGYAPFTVPVEDGRLLQSDLDRIVMMIVEAAPEEWTPPGQEED